MYASRGIFGMNVCNLLVDPSRILQQKDTKLWLSKKIAAAENFVVDLCS